MPMPMSSANRNRMVRPMPRTAPRPILSPIRRAARHLREAVMSLPGTTIQRDPRDGQPWGAVGDDLGARGDTRSRPRARHRCKGEAMTLRDGLDIQVPQPALLSLPDDVRRDPRLGGAGQARPTPVPGCGPPARCRPSALLRGGLQRLGPARRTAGRCPGHRTALGWLRPRGARPVGRAPRLRRPRRDADPAGGGRRSAYPLTVGSDRGGVAGAARVDHDSVRARVVGNQKRSTAAAWRYGRCLQRAPRHHRRAREDEPGPSKGTGGAEGSSTSRRG